MRRSAGGDHLTTESCLRRACHGILAARSRPGIEAFCAQRCCCPGRQSTVEVKDTLPLIYLYDMVQQRDNSLFPRTRALDSSSSLK